MKNTVLSSVALSLTLVMANGAYASDTKTIIKHREAVMEAVGGHFGAAFSTMRGMEQFDGNHVFHAESVARLAKIAVDIFPAGSGEGKTKALPAIWEKPEAFAKAMDDFVLKADAFAAAAKADDRKAYAAAAKELGGSCKGCHDDFKKE